MSSKPRKKRQKKVVKEVEAEPAPRPKVIRPAGKPPFAEVEARHLGEMKVRRGRGFSVAEIAAALLTPNVARRIGIAVDSLRRSSLDRNVTALRGWYKPKLVETDAQAGTDVKTKPAAVKKPRKKSQKG